MAADTTEGYKQALMLFGQIPGWKDAGDMAAYCRKKIQGDAPTNKSGEVSKPPKPAKIAVERSVRR